MVAEVGLYQPVEIVRGGGVFQPSERRRQVLGCLERSRRRVLDGG
jgi:hypothetical protein